MMVIEFMMKLANFDLIPTQQLDEEIYYWPESEGAYNVNFEMAGVQSKLLLANIGFVIYTIYAHLLAVLLHCIIHKCRNVSKCL